MLHLFHPALGHLAVAFLVIGAGTEGLALVAGRDRAARWGGSLLLVGLAALVPVIASGYLAANTVEVPAAAAGLLDLHELNGWLLLALALASQFWKAWAGGRVPDRQRRAYVALLAAVVASTLYGAWLGGQMVYVQGIGVLR
jgi:uncharacterized membrane protein